MLFHHCTFEANIWELFKRLGLYQPHNNPIFHFFFNFSLHCFVMGVGYSFTAELSVVICKYSKTMIHCTYPMVVSNMSTSIDLLNKEVETWRLAA